MHVALRHSSDCGVARGRDGVSGFSVAQRLSQSLEGPVFDQAFVIYITDVKTLASAGS